MTCDLQKPMTLRWWVTVWPQVWIFETAPIPVTPMTIILWCDPYLCHTLSTIFSLLKFTSRWTLLTMSYGEQSGPKSTSSFSTLSGPQPSRSTSTFASSDWSKNFSGDQGAISAESGSSNPPPEDGRIALLKSLEESVDSFRDRKISKTAMISSILWTLRENSNVQITESQKEMTFNSYFTEILAIQSSLDETNGTREAKETLMEPNQPWKSGNDKHGTWWSRKEGESESEDDEESSSKKPHLNKSEMPWFSSSDEQTITLRNPSCEETCRLLRAYSQDVSKAKSFIKIAPNSPVGFPSSQWEQILKGESVDLNQVFSSLHHEERMGCLGDSEITFGLGVAEAKKRVLSAAEWSAAWRK